ncbi:MAG: NlpC/P60 family protein [Cellulosilyticum sp.]|nr:NlpC/P60 family protein [Cellulosilyticum sp.]
MGALAVPLCASTHKESIFPSYTGIRTKVVDSSIKVRNYPNKYSNQLATIENQDIYILGMNHDWYRIRIGNQEGWVEKTDIQVSDHAIVPYSKVLGEEVVEYGKLFIGTPYVWGGNDLKRGVDCSGLTKKVFEGFDINISRLSYTQVNDGKEVDKSELRPGDLVFFDTSGANTGNISHVGIYAGQGMFLHADCTKGVTLSSLSNTYYKKNYVTSSRILNEI